MKTITIESCRGQCCRDNRQWGICAHQYKCEHHANQAAREAKRQSWEDFVNGLTNAPDLPRKRNR